MSSLFNRAFRLAAGIALAGCGGGDATPTATVQQTTSMLPASVTIAPATVPALNMGSSVTLAATVSNANGQVITNILVEWSSSNASVATVSSSGVVSAIAAGTASITAVAGSRSASVTITVNAATTGSSSETLATLPQVYLNTAMAAAPAPGGVIISVAAGGNFQTALNSAQPGDVIELANGATFTGNFVLPNKNTTSTKWIVIRPANMAGVPAEGARMTASLAGTARLPILLTATNQGAINTALGAHHYRLVGLEITLTPGNTGNTNLVRFGDTGSGGQTTLAVVAHDLVIDRSYLHGTTTQSIRRAITLQSASSSVIDSYISEIHEAGGDAQAIEGWNGPGPYKIVNNYLEASTENINWGGADPDIAGVIPSDIEVRHNHFFKPVSWKGKWLVKNLYESKASRRSLIEGNIFENNWQDGQGGSAIVLKSTNQGGGCTWCVTEDVTFRYNLIRNTGAGFALSASPDPNYAIPMRRITIHDNVVANIDVGPTYNGDGRGFLINQNPADVTLMHNTLIAPTNTAVAFGGPIATPPIRLAMRDNVMGGGQYGVKGPGLTAGSPTISTFMLLSAFVGNVVVLSSSAGYPAGNFYPTTVAATGFVNVVALDFRLVGTSPLRNTATDGRDPGANIDAITAATAGVIVP